LGTGTTIEFTIPLQLPDTEPQSCSVPVTHDDATALLMLGAPPSPHEPVAASDSVRVQSRFSLDVRQLPGSEVEPAVVTPLPPLAPPPPSLLPPPPPPLISILVAEDDRLSQTLMRKLMPKLGFAPTIVGTGVAAVEAACASAAGTGDSFELIVMDLQCVALRFRFRLPPSCA
jgi:hypothetical protein